MASEIKKLYRLEAIGGQQLVKELQEINRLFKDIRKAKQDLNTERAQVEDPTALREITARLEELKVKEKELAISLKEKQMELKAEQILQKQLAIQRQQELNDKRQQQAGNQALAGSYNDIAKKYRELLAISKNATDLGNPEEVARATAELKKYKDQLDAFNRSLSKDGTLVGEYTSGIVEAFKRLGAGDLIKDKIQSDKDAVKQLNAEFEALKRELSDIRVTGSGSLEVIEANMIANRQEAQRLERQLEEINAAFTRQSGIGGQVVAGLRDEFRNAGSQLKQLVVSYLGFQALLTTSQSIFRDTIKLDSQASAMQVVSGNAEELAKNEQFLAEITERLGLQILDTTQSFKGFFAASTQAGISAEETRNIFESASAASANLKLSQEDTNGVLLAFGQIASKGKVQAEELRGQIGERIPGAFSIAAKAIGVTQAELNKMLENGEVIASDFLPKFARELRNTFGGESATRVEGLQASINRLRNQFTQMIAENQQGITKFLSGFIKAGGVLLSIIAALTGNLPLVITLLSAYALGWAVVNKETVIANARLLLVNTQLVAARLALGVVTTLTYAYSAALAVFTGATRVASAAVTIFNNVIRASPLGWLLAIIGVVGAAFTAFAGKVNGSTESLKENARQLQLNADLQRAIADSTADTISRMQALISVILSNNIALNDKKKALADLIAINPAYLGTLTLQNIRTAEGIGILQSYVKALREKAEIEAIAAGRTKALQSQMEAQANAARAATDPEFARSEYRRINPNTPFSSSVADAFKYGTTSPESKAVQDYWNKKAEDQEKAIGYYDLRTKVNIYKSGKELQQSENKAHVETMGEKRERLEAEIDANKKRIAALDASNLAGAEKLRKSNEALQKQIDKIDGKEDKAPKARVYGGARIDGADKDRLGIIDAGRDSRLNAEMLRMAQLRRLRATTEDEEVEHLKNLQKIREDAADKKLALLNAGNAAEQKKSGEIKLERIRSAQETEDAIFKIRSESLERTRNKAIDEADDKRSAVDENPDATAADKARAASEYYGAVIAAQQAFNESMDALEKQLSLKSRNNADARIKELRKLNRDGAKATREELLAEMNQQIAEEEALYQKSTSKALEAMGKKIAAIANGKGSTASKQNNIQQVKDSYEKSFLEDEVKRLDAEKAILDEARAKGIIGEEEYSKRIIEITNKRTAAIGRLIELQTKKEYTEAEKRALILESAFHNAEKIANAYVQSQSREIESDNEKTTSALQNEKERQLAQAQSAAERQAIEETFAGRQAELEKKRAREQKELARKQMIIEYALASLKIFATQGMSPKAWTDFALLTANFAVGMALIKSQTFEKGGVLGNIMRSGGRFQGPSHAGGGIKFLFRGMPTEVEGEEGYVVNKKSMASSRRMTVSGTPAQIASAANVAGGGVNFAPGAYMKYFAAGGMLGASLRPPVYISAATSGSAISDERFLQMLGLFAQQQLQIATQQEQMSLLKVAVPVQQVTDIQAGIRKASAIATL